MDRYAADPPAARIAVPLDGLTLVYHRPSRTTHVLDSPAPELLDALHEGAANVGELAARLARTHRLAADEGADVRQAIAARLDELAAAGLVRRVPASATP